MTPGLSSLPSSNFDLTGFFCFTGGWQNGQYGVYAILTQTFKPKIFIREDIEEPLWYDLWVVAHAHTISTKELAPYRLMGSINNSTPLTSDPLLLKVATMPIGIHPNPTGYFMWNNGDHVTQSGVYAFAVDSTMMVWNEEDEPLWRLASLLLSTDRAKLIHRPQRVAQNLRVQALFYPRNRL